MFDTNVIVSAVYNPGSKPDQALRNACRHHELVLCDYAIAECYNVVQRRFPQHAPVLDALMASLRYETAIAPRGPNARIPDPKDAPILNAALLEDVDIIVSGDRHFLQLEMERPQVMTAAEFLEHIE
jgi:predicted nucleic acid-binding protein